MKKNETVKSGMTRSPLSLRLEYRSLRSWQALVGRARSDSGKPRLPPMLEHLDLILANEELRCGVVIDKNRRAVFEQSSLPAASPPLAHPAVWRGLMREELLDRRSRLREKIGMLHTT
jgi:hypothetical protein